MGGAKTLQPLSLERVGKEGRGAACTKGGAWGCARSKGFLRIGAHGSQISSLLVAVRNGVYVHKSVQKYAIFPIRQNKSGKSLWFVHGIWFFDTGMMGEWVGKGIFSVELFCHVNYCSYLCIKLMKIYGRTASSIYHREGGALLVYGGALPL